MPCQLVGQFHSASLSAALSTTTVFTTIQPGIYRVTWYCKKIANDGAASTSGALTLAWTEVDSTAMSYTCPAFIPAGTVATQNATDSATITGTMIGVPLMINCAAATAITVAMAYSSGTPGNMKYNLHVHVEKWDVN
jgi:hypothetical protein